MKRVSKNECDAFIKAYPNKLARDVATMGEPPILTFNDFSIAPRWPDSVVAKIVLHEDSYRNEDGSKRPNEYFILAEQQNIDR